MASRKLPFRVYKGPLGPFIREEALAIEGDIQCVAGRVKLALSVIRPLALNDRHGGKRVVVRGFGGDVQAVKLAIGLVAARRGVGYVVSQQIKRLHAGAKATGCESGQRIHCAEEKARRLPSVATGLSRSKDATPDR